MTKSQKREEGTPEQRHELTVLVVDDDADVRRTIAEMLMRMQFRVVEASDGQEALEICTRTEKISVLLTDIIMPGMTGRMLADKIKAIYPDLKVLLMSGHIDEERTIRLKPGLHYMQKPVTRKKLADNMAALFMRASPSPDG